MVLCKQAACMQHPRMTVPTGTQVVLVILCIFIYGLASLLILIRQRQLDQPQASLEHEEKLNKSLGKAAALQDRYVWSFPSNKCKHFL